MKVIKRHIPAIIFILYLMFIYFQHQFVFMYFDDYGYASLSYGASSDTAFFENHRSTICF